MLFEAAQVHRRLCAPRQMRCGDFHIASEIFAVRQLPGDFVIREKRAAESVAPLFIITLYPHRTVSKVPYAKLETAMHHARLVAAKRGHVQVWREVNDRPGTYERVTR